MPSEMLQNVGTQIQPETRFPSPPPPPSSVQFCFLIEDFLKKKKIRFGRMKKMQA